MIDSSTQKKLQSIHIHVCWHLCWLTSSSSEDVTLLSESSEVLLVVSCELYKESAQLNVYHGIDFTVSTWTFVLLELEPLLDGSSVTVILVASFLFLISLARGPKSGTKSFISSSDRSWNASPSISLSKVRNGVASNFWRALLLASYLFISLATLKYLHNSFRKTFSLQPFTKLQHCFVSKLHFQVNFSSFSFHTFSGSCKLECGANPTEHALEQFPLRCALFRVSSTSVLYHLWQY